MSGAPSKPRHVPTSSSPNRSMGRSPAANSRADSIARLGSPVASLANSVSQAATPQQPHSGNPTPLPGAEGSSTVSGPGHSALAAAFEGSFGRSPPKFGTPPVRSVSPFTPIGHLQSSVPQTTYGSFDSNTGQGGARGWGTPNEDAKIVKRHLVQPKNLDGVSEASQQGATLARNGNRGLDRGRSGVDEDEFSSLNLQGGDITRDLYRWAEEAESPTKGRRGKRSYSWHNALSKPKKDTENANSIKAPGGFRRDFIKRRAPSPDSREACTNAFETHGESTTSGPAHGPITRNFIEFLTIYGHFAGEELEEDDEDGLSDDNAWMTGQVEREDDEADRSEPGEGSALLASGELRRKKRMVKERGSPGTNTRAGAALLLLKSFVGTGVLFLPRAYLNGGMLFSNLVIVGVAALSYYCFVLLVNTRLKVVGSFGDMGGILYGRWLRWLILASVALSQVGFVSAYIVFTSESMQAFIVAVSNCKTWINIKIMVLIQLVILLPLSLIRDISKLGKTALVADAFIILGLIYLGYFDIHTIVANGGVADITRFNSKNWTLFIGTAIFTFEGVGLIIPIQESMKYPTQFPPVLAAVMVGITLLFTLMGALSYAAFGSKTRTVVLLNLPQDDKFVNAVQLLYSLAILLSTPLQLFPAIRIMESGIFTRSGKDNRFVKWRKNAFRFFLVVMCGLIAWLGAADLDKFVSLVGSFACVPLVYVYPAMLHYKAVAKSHRQRVGDVLLCCFGIVVMVYTTALTLRSWFGSEPAIKAPGYCDE